MQLFGLTITTTKALNSILSSCRGWWGWPWIKESFAGAWQRNIELRLEDALSYWPVFRCVSLISADIAKLGLNLVEENPTGVWNKVTSNAFSPVLRKPNRYQTRIQFFENWLQSKLTRGNTYVLKQRDQRGVVIELYVLDPCLVKPLVADDGSVFYQLSKDNLSGLIEDSIIVPASEIIHDRWNTLYHPLCGLSPIYAAAINTAMGLRIQNMSTKFFENGAVPSGVVIVPGAIDDATASRLKETWQTNFGGKNSGRVAILGDGMKYERTTMTSVDAQLIEQLKWTAETIAAVFGVPIYMIIGTPPTYNNVQALTLQYYSQCLQILIESIEILLDEGLGLNRGTRRRTLGVMFDLDDLMRMDTSTQFDVVQKAKGTLTLDEARRRVGVGPVEGGDTIYLQQQDHSLAAIAARDAMLIEQSQREPEEEPAPVDEEEVNVDVERVISSLTTKAAERFACYEGS